MTNSDRYKKYYYAHREEICEKRKAKYRENPEPARAYQKKYRETHKEQRREKAREAYRADPEKRKARSLAYYYAHKDEISQKNKERYRARKAIDSLESIEEEFLIGIGRRTYEVS